MDVNVEQITEGPIEKFKRIGWPSRIYTLSVIAYAFAMVLIQIVIASRAQDRLCYLVFTDARTGERSRCTAECSPEFVASKAITTIVYTLFVLWSGLDGIYHDNLYELYASQLMAALNLVITVVTFADYAFVERPSDIAQLVVVCASLALWVVIAYPIYKEYSWRLYNKIGSDADVRAMYRNYLLCCTFLKMGLCFELVQVIVNLPSKFADSTAACVDSTIPTPPTPAPTPNDGAADRVFIGLGFTAIIISIVYAVTGWQGIKRELTPLVVVFFALAPFNPALTIYLFVVESGVEYATSEENVFANIVFWIAGVSALLARALNVVLGILCARKFGRGLKNLNCVAEQREQLKESLMADTGEVGEGEEISLADVIKNTRVANDVYIQM